MLGQDEGVGAVAGVVMREGGDEKHRERGVGVVFDRKAEAEGFSIL